MTWPTQRTIIPIIVHWNKQIKQICSNLLLSSPRGADRTMWYLLTLTSVSWYSTEVSRKSWSLECSFKAIISLLFPGSECHGSCYPSGSALDTEEQLTGLLSVLSLSPGVHLQARDCVVRIVWLSSHRGVWLERKIITIGQLCHLPERRKTAGQ